MQGKDNAINYDSWAISRLSAFLQMTKQSRKGDVGTAEIEG